MERIRNIGGEYENICHFWQNAENENERKKQKLCRTHSHCRLPHNKNRWITITITDSEKEPPTYMLRIQIVSNVDASSDCSDVNALYDLCGIFVVLLLCRPIKHKPYSINWLNQRDFR